MSPLRYDPLQVQQIIENMREFNNQAKQAVSTRLTNQLNQATNSVEKFLDSAPSISAFCSPHSSCLPSPSLSASSLSLLELLTQNLLSCQRSADRKNVGNVFRARCWLDCSARERGEETNVGLYSFLLSLIIAGIIAAGGPNKQPWAIAVSSEKPLPLFAPPHCLLLLSYFSLLTFILLHRLPSASSSPDIHINFYSKA